MCTYTREYIYKNFVTKRIFCFICIQLKSLLRRTPLFSSPSSIDKILSHISPSSLVKFVAYINHSMIEWTILWYTKMINHKFINLCEKDEHHFPYRSSISFTYLIKWVDHVFISLMTYSIICHRFITPSFTFWSRLSSYFLKKWFG